MRGSFLQPSFGSFFESFAAGNEMIIAGAAPFGNSEVRSVPVACCEGPFSFVRIYGER